MQVGCGTVWQNSNLWRRNRLAHARQCLDTDSRGFRPTGCTTGSHRRDRAAFSGRLRWRPIDEFNVDLIYGPNIYDENANWITLATVFRFNAGK
jgi:hypothetical protein